MKHALSTALMVVLSVPLLAQWSPNGKTAVWVSIDGSIVLKATINTDCHPWGPDGRKGTADDVTTSEEFRKQWSCRYAGNRPYEEWKGLNPRGFANEMFNRNYQALERLGVDDPSDELAYDYAYTHKRTCSNYLLTAEEGCGGTDGGGSEAEELPRRLVDYCKEWGWSAPGHAGPSNAACKAYRGCEQSICPCFDERRATTASGGSWVFFDPTQPSCRPDRAFDDGGEGGSGGDGTGEGGDGGDEGGGDGGVEGGGDGGSGGPRNACDDALEKLEQALREAQRVCPVGG
jgi:hypothetical protein